MKTACLLIVMALFMGAIAFADTTSTAAGAAEYTLLTSLVTGSLGTLFGLVVVIIGIYSLSQGQTTSGLILIILGALFVVLPTFYTGVKTVACQLVQSFGGCGSSTSSSSS